MASSARPRDVHDRLIKRVFGRQRAFAVVLRRVLPPELLAHLDLGTLTRCSTERTDERLRGRISDLCFTADLIDGERRRPVYFPLEHHSTMERLFPLRAVTCATELWHEHLADHPAAIALPLVVPILLTQPAARHTPTQLSAVLDVPPSLRDHFPSPIEARVFADDLSGSVLGDPVADPVTLANVELARAFLYAHKNPSSLTPERLAELAPLFDVLLSQPEPLATNDVRALLTYVLCAFAEGSPVRELVASALQGRPREMFVSIADSLIAKGRAAGLSEGRAAGLSEGRAAGLSEGRAAGLSEGRAAGLSRAVLRVLEHRSVPVSEPVRARLEATRSEHQLQRWLERALTASSVDDVFDDVDERR
jgi:predicted transposase YdaD